MELIIPIELNKKAHSIPELDKLYFDFWQFNLKTKAYYMPKKKGSN